MNCKQGDLALIIRSAAGNEGKAVTCLEYMGTPGVMWYGNKMVNLAVGYWWRVDRDLNMLSDDIFYPDHSPFVRDDQLRPINGLPDKELEDESLSSPLQNALVQ